MDEPKVIGYNRILSFVKEPITEFLDVGSKKKKTELTNQTSRL